ncbi:MAG TPA: GAF domain-containing protein [Anaerolineales bacterium]|nr:GAF domain-containing protein [Anaerolineales bacterium]
MFRSERHNQILDQVLQIVVLVYQAVSLMALVVIPILAVTWLQRPFLGAFVEQTMVFNGVGQSGSDPAWALFQDKSLALTTQLVEVNGKAVQSEAQIQNALAGSHPGQSIPLGLRALAGGQTTTRLITLQTFPAASRTIYFIIPYIVGVLFLGISLWIFGMRRNESAGRAFALFSTSVGVACAGLFDLYTTHALALLWTLALACAGGAMVDLALVFPQEARWVQARPYLRWIGYLLGLVLFVLAAVNLYNFHNPTAYILNWRYIYILDSLSMLFLAGMFLYRWIATRSPVVRQQAGAILVGMLVAFGPLAAWFLVTAAMPKQAPPGLQWLASLFSFNFPPYLLLLTVVFPLVTGYSVLHHRLVRTDLVFRQAVLYAALTVLALGGFALLVSGLTLIFGQAFQVTNPLFIGVLVFILAVCLNPVRNRLQRYVDNIFFRGVQAYEQRVHDFSRALTNTVDLAVIVRTLREHIAASLLPAQMHVYIFDPINDQFTAAPGEDGHPTSDIRFTLTSPLVSQLQKSSMPVALDLSALPAELKPEQTRLALLNTLLFVPMPGSEHPIGWLALGPRRSGEIYRSRDLGFLEQIGDAAAVAVERAQVIDRLERRVREMNILARVAQGVNVTVAFDDIMELIYAQTDQALPVDDFHITLYDKDNNYYYFAFCVEKDDRITARENVPMPMDTGLSPEVIQSRRGILTADYTRECQARGVKVYTEGVYAWTGVPLNTGAETIGALSVGSRDASVVYTPAQQTLLQSIAEQAAGAIIKARLFGETERRARQLSILNDITRQLTGTLETEPLLQKILDSAVSILNCEAGSLFLVDETTNELVFKATAGPVAQYLVGQHLASGTGIVGEAVQTGQAVISNNVQQASTWFASTDKATGFVTRSILAVPMQVKESVIGVLEVINRKDGLPFVEDDQNLLSAFGGQAAVAIDNARLYTLTDQELNARVEELSVMQRIDRELNASLDVRRAMRLTLEWAMRQSGADSGLIGILQDKGMRLMAQQGYEEIEQTYKETLMPLEQLAMHSAVETGQPQRIALDEKAPGLLAGASTQTVIPIRREAIVIGLIVLESRQAETQSAETLAFLSRLSDHAAIAIANAQLYQEVQAANEAKSEFVSFVAHELKNPMTSIKGYSELLAKGAVGPITDMQANFLATIRSNVERMSTLVSDLNDNSKIEAGRLRLDFKAIELAGVVDEVMRSTKRQLEDKKQTAILLIPPKLPNVWADPTRLAQIIVNLVSNANKYTPEGGSITIGAEKSANQWDPAGAALVVHIWVKDNGIGISLEDQKKIFQKFFRSEDSKARESPGTGLGLNITRSLIEMMGGRVWFESEFRQGTTFHFTVPVAEG